MNELQVFKNPEFGTVRTVEVNGEPWLVGKDVAEALGYTNSRKALIDHQLLPLQREWQQRRGRGPQQFAEGGRW